MTNVGARQVGPGVRTFLLILASAAIVVLVHWPSYASIASMWFLMPYRHGYLIFPAAAYFLWQQRDEIGLRSISASWAGCVALLALTVLWLVARATTVLAVEQIAAVLMIPAFVLAALGPAVLRAAAFPLLLTLAAVPVGETLVPGLMSVTADVAELLLWITGVPVFREGQVIRVPSGWFEVAVICAGLNYLLAGVVTAIVFARQAFGGWRKRLVFVALAAVAFVLANGIRVFLVIYLHDLSNGRIFAHDHVWFGMVIFGATLVALLVLGARFADQAKPAQPPGEIRQPRYPGRSSAVVAIVGLAILAAGPLVAARSAANGAGLTELRWPPLPAIDGCDGPQVWAASWGPFMVGSDLERSGSYFCDNQQVDVFVAVYSSQGQGKELVSSENELIPDYLASRGTRSSRAFQSALAELVGTAEISVSGEAPEVVWLWYSVGEAHATTSLGVKTLEALNALQFKSAPSALYVVAVRNPLASPDEMRQTVERASRALWDSARPGRKAHESR